MCSGRTRKSGSRLTLLIIAAALTVACSNTKQSDQKGLNSNATPASPAPKQTIASSDPERTLPALSEVEQAIQRVYVNTVEVDQRRGAPFIVGDFNGDGSQDLVAVVKPVKGALPKLNSEYANWIVEDPKKIALPEPDKDRQKLPPPAAREQIRQDDLLLLVLHGYQQEGWRHPYARQTFLLKNAVGEELRAERLNQGSEAGNKSASQKTGDVINEKLGGQEGFLYWTNARYAWRQ
jgi:hypothetical protein